MKWFKWWYAAIPLGILIVYELLSPKAALAKGKAGGTGATGFLNSLGSAGTGLGTLWSDIAGSSSQDTSSVDATGD